MKSRSLQSFEDRIEISDVMKRYAFGVDKRLPEVIADCFQKNVFSSYNGIELGEGRDKIVRLMSAASSYVSTMHHVGTIFFHDLSAEFANVEHYSIAYLLSRTENGSHVLVTRGVNYQDKLVKVSAGWKIQHRIHSVAWSVEMPAVPSPALPEAFLRSAGIID